MEKKLYDNFMEEKVFEHVDQVLEHLTTTRKMGFDNSER